MEFRRAIVREPGDSYRGCISSHPMRWSIDVQLARRQHSEYRKALQELGLEIIELPRDDKRADSCFVEDCVVVHGSKAFVCRAAKESRRGEEGPVADVLAQYMPLARASEPATIEGGDVIHLENRLISGLSQRTNADGIAQMSGWLDISVDTIADMSIVHLKSYVNYLGNGVMLATRKYAGADALKGFEVIVVPDDEWYATNVLAFDDRVIMASGYPGTRELLEKARYSVLPLQMSEFPKCEGALTCLSVLF